MKHNKKWLALLLAVCLCVTLLPMGALAAGATVSPGGKPSRYTTRDPIYDSTTKTAGESGYYYRLPRLTDLCTRCGRVMDVFSEHIDKSLESIAADFKDGQISDYKARFFGICKECLKEESH